MHQKEQLIKKMKYFSHHESEKYFPRARLCDGTTVSWWWYPGISSAIIFIIVVMTAWTLTPLSCHHYNNELETPAVSFNTNKYEYLCSCNLGKITHPRKKNSHHIIFLSEQLKKNQEPWIDKSGIDTVNRFIQIFIKDYQIFWS